MSCYIVSYDVAQPGDYGPLYDKIKAYSTWAKITESTWAIVTDQTAQVIRDNLATTLKPADRLIVVRSGVESAWFSLPANVSEWLKKYL